MGAGSPDEVAGVPVELRVSATVRARYSTRMDAVIAQRRLIAQHIARPTLRTAREVVASMGAIQAQDLPGSMWAIALRTQGALTVEDVTQAAARGEIVRTHAMRGTWQWM